MKDTFDTTCQRCYAVSGIQCAAIRNTGTCSCLCHATAVAHVQPTVATFDVRAIDLEVCKVCGNLPIYMLSKSCAQAERYLKRLWSDDKDCCDITRQELDEAKRALRVILNG